MRQWRGSVRFYSGVAFVTGVASLASACSFDVTAPQSIVSITSSQDTMTIGALRFTGTIAIIDTTIRVFVMVKNDSTASVPYLGGCIQSLGLALYQNAARSGTPVLELPPPPDPRMCPVAILSLAPGDSITFTGMFPLSQVRQVATGMYYVAAPLSRPAATSIRVDAGVVLISGSLIQSADLRI
jgi:hypothetical protein